MDHGHIRLEKTDLLDPVRLLAAPKRTRVQARDLNAEPLSKIAEGERANLLEGPETAVIEATRRQRQNPVNEDRLAIATTPRFRARPRRRAR